MNLWQMFVLVFELSRGLLSEALPAVTLQLETVKMTLLKSSFSSKRCVHHSRLLSLLASQIAWQYLAVKVQPSPLHILAIVLTLYLIFSAPSLFFRMPFNAEAASQLIIFSHCTVNASVMGFWNFPWRPIPWAVTYTACCAPSSKGVVDGLMGGDDPFQDQFSLHNCHFASSQLGPQDNSLFSLISS